PDTPLTAMAPASLGDDTTATVTATMKPGKPEPHTLLQALATAHTHGTPTTWAQVFAPTNATPTPLPTTPFTHHHYWLPSETSTTKAPASGPAVDDGFWTALESEGTPSLAARLKVDAEALESVLPALSSFRDRERERALADGWRYKAVWRKVAAPAALTTGTPRDGAWLVAVPTAAQSSDDVNAIVDGLADRGARVHTVVVGGQDRAELASTLHAVARPPATDNDDAPDGTAPAVAGILSLLPLDDAPHEDHPTLSRGLAATITLIQALADAELSGAPLWVATSGAVAVEETVESSRPFQTAAWGLGAVLALDHPETWGGLVDVPAGPEADDIALLHAVLTGGDGEDQVAIRSGSLFARRLVHAAVGGGPADPEQRTWTPRGTVLVTGGTSGVGANVARWLAREGAERLVLVSRRGDAAPGVGELTAELAALGAAVEVAACDVTDREALRTLLDALSDGPPLTAVMHAAGVGHDDVLVPDTSPGDFAGFGRAKVAGAINLDELLGDDRPLDAFVMFSSVSAVWGSGGQAPYAAANAFLDGLAQRRRARGLAGSSIAWGGWGGGGMMDASVQAHMGRFGMRPMEPGAAASAIGRALGRGDHSLVVTDIDWERFAPAFGLSRPRPLMGSIPEFAQALSEPAGASGPGDSGEPDSAAFAKRLADLSPAEQERTVVALVRSAAAGVLGHDSDDPVRPDRAFNELGFDSLTAVELRNRLRQATGVKLPATLVFDHPTPNALARFMLERLAPRGAGSAASILDRLGEVEVLLREQTLSAGERARLGDRFRALLNAAEAVNGQAGDGAGADDAGQDVDGLSDDELFAALDDELGTA
ncbi:SDR family NAD(P)-dependent oxidoreductase, partial [Nocardiopsis sediminis]